MKVLAVSTGAALGVKKENQPEITLIRDFGAAGDAHAGLDPRRQVSLLAWESIELMAGRGLEPAPGDFAENITTEGLELHTLPLGAILKLGPSARLEVSQIGKTCHHGCAVKTILGDCIMPRRGIFGRVVSPGPIRPGDAIEVEKP